MRPAGLVETGGSTAISQFTSLVGIDGAGKSTVLSAVRARRQDLFVVHWRDAQSRLFPGPRGEQHMRNALDIASPSERADIIVRLHELEAEQISAKLAAGIGVIVDSYWYKVAAREERLGRSEPTLTDRLQQLPQPWAVIFLEIDPLVARARKSSLTAFEHPGDPAQFANFQRSVQDRIHELVAAVAVHVVPAGEPPDAVAVAVLELLERLQPGGGAERKSRSSQALATGPP